VKVRSAQAAVAEAPPHPEPRRALDAAGVIVMLEAGWAAASGRYTTAAPPVTGGVAHSDSSGTFRGRHQSSRAVVTPKFAAQSRTRSATVGQLRQHRLVAGTAPASPIMCGNGVTAVHP
jgi:hypothetical protein